MICHGCDKIYLTARNPSVSLGQQPRKAANVIVARYTSVYRRQLNSEVHHLQTSQCAPKWRQKIAQAVSKKQLLRREGGARPENKLLLAE